MEIEAKTEESYQALLVQHLSNEQQNVVLKKRAAKDELYNRIFQDFISNGQNDIMVLVSDLQ
jgi:hypothetical protein